jgi:MT0933-like antitoxin protein
MSDFIDKAKDAVGDVVKKAQDVVKDHGDKVTGAVDKATDVVDDKTGGKASEHLQKVDDLTEKAVDKLGGDDDPAPA